MRESKESHETSQIKDIFEKRHNVTLTLKLIRRFSNAVLVKRDVKLYLFRLEVPISTILEGQA